MLPSSPFFAFSCSLCKLHIGPVVGLLILGPVALYQMISHLHLVPRIKGIGHSLLVSWTKGGHYLCLFKVRTILESLDNTYSCPSASTTFGGEGP